MITVSLLSEHYQVSALRVFSGRQSSLSPIVRPLLNDNYNNRLFAAETKTEEAQAPLGR